MRGGDGVKVRFHLGAGPHKGHFQITDKAGVRYYDPAKFQLRIVNARLHNNRRMATKIFKGESNKNVCSWIRCDRVEIYSETILSSEGLDSVKYNPKVAPYWRDGETDDNRDKFRYGSLITDGKNVFVLN